MIIDCVSDLHGHYPKLEGGDLLILAGDLTKHDYHEEYVQFFQWLLLQQYKRKILVAGNHDNRLRGLYKIPEEKTDLDYLCDSGTEFEGLKIWGSPWTKTFPGINPKCKAFTLYSEQQLFEKFELIPDDVDILVTHSPVEGVLDKVGNKHVGSRALYGCLKYVFRPKLHVCGHIHEGYGKEEYFTDCISVNASHVNENYEPVNKPIRVIL